MTKHRCSVFSVYVHFARIFFLVVSLGPSLEIGQYQRQCESVQLRYLLYSMFTYVAGNPVEKRQWL